ncbi:MAG: hypothetical protein OFPI_23200 [Osedax symbiont Rs2]|nr:MAG: hypothetical protein OFPI_23200 [Osedax symbiont Rs2]
MQYCATIEDFSNVLQLSNIPVHGGWVLQRFVDYNLRAGERCYSNITHQFSR